MNNPPIVYRFLYIMCESTSSQPPLKRFRLLAQDMMEHSSAAAVTVTNTVDTELITYFADCKTYSETVDLNSGSRMPINTHCWLHLPRTCCQLLHLRHTQNVFSVCGELTAGKRNRLTKSLEKRIMLKTNLKYYAWFSMILFSRLLVNISGSSAR